MNYYRIGGRERAYNVSLWTRAISIGGLILSALAGILIVGPAKCSTPYDNAPPEKCELNSSKPFHEVRIAFKSMGGAVIVLATISGQSVECLLDTGFNGILIPDQLGVACKPFGRPVRRQDASGHIVENKSVLIDELKLGDCAVRNARASLLNTSDSASSQYSDFNKHTVLVGTRVLKDMVVTIDYKTSELILRDGAYDCSAQKPSDAILTQFRLANHGVSGYGLPVVTANIEGKPAQLILDTGFVGAAFALQKGFISKNSALKTRQAAQTDDTAVLGVSTLKQIKGVNVSLDVPGSLDIVGDALEISLSARDIDGLLGGDILSQFRVTFDFPRKRVLLEAYDKDFRAMLAGRLPDSNTRDQVVKGFLMSAGGVKYILPPGTIVGPRSLDGRVKIAYPDGYSQVVQLPPRGFGSGPAVGGSGLSGLDEVITSKGGVNHVIPPGSTEEHGNGTVTVTYSDGYKEVILLPAPPDIGTAPAAPANPDPKKGGQ
jgi:hypothetical protein